MKLNLLLGAVMTLMAYVPSAHAAKCTPQVVARSYDQTSTLAVMYGNYGVGNSDDDLKLAKLGAIENAEKTCATLRLKNCTLVDVRIVEDVSYTLGIPYVRAVARFVGCR